MTETYNYREKKIVAVLSSNLEAGVALNVIGHLAISLGSHAQDEIMGRHILIDASNVEHSGISKYPFIITKVKPAKLRKAITEARGNKNILVADYPKEMLTTGHDDELSTEISKILESEIEYLGAIFYGTKKEIDIITGKFTLWH